MNMKIAILSDIHGNYVALERCMNYALDKGIDTFLFLGDYIGELAYPQKAMKMLYDIKEKYHCTFIGGNKEGYWINYRKYGNDDWGWKDKDSTTGMLLYAYNHLTESDIDFFESMPISEKIDIEGYKPFIICHGSPEKVNEYLKHDGEITYEVMERAETDLIVGGHTHIQGKTIYKGKVLLNPGAVGIPLKSDGKTQFLILQSYEGGWQEEFVSLHYDVEKVIEDMKADKLEIRAPWWNYSTERLLRDGRTSNGTVLDRAMELCRNDVGECNWPHIPERYWAEAIKEIYG